MILGIDASNIRGGGGLTHLSELLTRGEPRQYGFDMVRIWGGKTTLERLPEREWLRKERQDLLDKNIIFRIYWQHTILGRLIRKNCDVLFVPGGLLLTKFHPLVTMSQNMLPFEAKERKRYGFSLTAMRLRLLRYGQSRAFMAADGLIFLTNYARDVVAEQVALDGKKVAIVPHGVSPLFVMPPRSARSISDYSTQDPCRILYVSIVDAYKHQDKVVKAVAKLRNLGYPIELNLVGPAYPRAMLKLEKIMDEQDRQRTFIKYHGPVEYGSLPSWYHNNDVFLFASSCENLPNILLEAMAAGLPIACSNKGPMPEVLRDAGVYFDPEDLASIYDAVKLLLDHRESRKQFAEKAFEYSRSFSWDRCADETFRFLANCASA